MEPLIELFQGVASPAAAAPPTEVVAALVLATLLMIIIGAVYKLTHRGQFYTQGFVHTLVIIGVLISVIIMVIGDNVSRAFAVFGAFSLIRFRNVIPEQRDVAFLLFSLAVGLAVGAQQYGMAVVTTVLVCLLILLLWRFDLFAPLRTSHILRVRVTSDLNYELEFREPFERLLERAELLSVESVQAGMMYDLKYAVRLKPGAAPGTLVTELQRLSGNNKVVLQAFGPNLGDYRVGDFSS